MIYVSNDNDILEMKYLSIAIEIVTAIFAAFGHFLLNISPPEKTGQFAVGISSFLALCAFLLIAAIRRIQPKWKYKRYWLIAAAVLFLLAGIFGLLYSSSYTSLVFGLPPEGPERYYIRGTEWTEVGQAYRDEHESKTMAQIVFDFGGDEKRTSVWTKESIDSAKSRLVLIYILFVVTLAGTIFCLGEGILTSPRRK